MRFRAVFAVVGAGLGALLAGTAGAAPTHLVDEAPVQITVVAPGVHLVDFGRVAFGNVRLMPPVSASAPPASASSPGPARVTVHFGEAMAAGRVDRQPKGTVRYGVATVTLVGEAAAVVAAPPADKRNTWQPATMDYREVAKMPGAPAEAPPPAILTPAEWGVVLPFRWVEIEGWPGELRPEHLRRQAIFARTWDDDAAAFHSSDEMLNRVWELCRYSIKATTFAGVYVDGDRERIPYEADAYLNQLSHYATDSDGQMARDTYDHLMRYPTWPTEWASHLVFMVHADWWQTGDRAWLAARFDALKTKLLLERAGPDGLITSSPAQIKQGDLVDWPRGERDGFVFTPVNSVVNAFYLRALEMMIELARALDRTAEVADYTARLHAGRAAFHEKFFNPATGLYRDGVGTDHSALHSNLFALRFGHVPAEHAPKVAAWLATRGMDCSVYVAQYFMEALFQHGADARALALMLAPGDRSWRHMVESGATITWEAWDLKYKPNQDWNHAWGAAPANLLPRFVLGAQPAAPGWSDVVIRPHPAGLAHAEGKIPTPRGPVLVRWARGEAGRFALDVTLPAGTSARVELPAFVESLPSTAAPAQVWLNGQPVAAARRGDRWVLDAPVTGRATIELK